MTTPDHNNDSNYNPYTYHLNCDSDNISEMFTILESISKACSDIIPHSGLLGSRYNIAPRLDILRHGYTTYALPTWHYLQIATQPKENTLSVVRSNSKLIASALHFLEAPEAKTKANPMYPTDDSLIESSLYLVSGTAKSYPGTVPDSITGFELFNSDIHAYPRIRIFDPYEYDPSNLSTAIYSGLIIESFEIDGSAIPMPNPDSTLDEENSQFLQSAIPLSHVRQATFFNASSANTTSVEIRAPNRSQGQKAHTMLYDLSDTRLGITDQENAEDIPQEPFGFRIVENFTWFSRMFSTLGFQTKTRENTSESITAPNAPENLVLVWSPYRYINITNAARPLEGIYMLTNFRTLYGTNVTLAEIPHFQDLIPIH